VFAVVTPGIPDGIKVDEEGRVYASSAGGVQVFSPDGDRLGEIAAPGATNFVFGGPAGDVLFILRDTAVLQAALQARGLWQSG
jgi:gluconolactonase